MNEQNAEGMGACDPNPLKQFALTLKPTLKKYKEEVFKSELFLKEKYNEISNKYNLIRMVSIIEKDSKNLYHIHATFLCAKMPFIKEKGWHVYVKEITDNSYWTNYMFKNYNQILTKEWFESNYGFIY